MSTGQSSIIPSTKLSDINSLLGKSSNASSTPGKTDISKNTYNIAGLGLPTNLTAGKTVVDADTFIKLLQATASTNPGVWAGLQYAMFRANYYGNTMPDLGAWGTTDATGVKNLMEALTSINQFNATPSSTVDVNSFLTQQENAAIKLGGNGIRTQIAKVTIPNALDLNYIADKAFRTALGRPPTAKESKAFVQSYQGDVMAAARSNATTTSTQAQAVSPAIPMQTTAPTVSSPAGHLIPNAQVAPPPETSIAQNYASASQVPTTSIVGQQDVANSDVAAAAFARKSAPAQAASQNVSVALDAMFASLARNSN